jgi:Zn-dependent protease with chaperone function
VAFGLLGIGACILLCVVAYRVQQDGFEALSGGTPEVTAAIVFLGLMAAGSIAGLLSLQRQWSATRALTNRVREVVIAPPPSLVHAARRAGLEGRVDLIESAELSSFTYGVTVRRVVLTQGLLASTTPAELDAVLEHERYHVTNLDPWKILVSRTLVRSLFFLPVLRDLRTRYAAARELSADRRAIDRHGRTTLASALYKVVDGSHWVTLSPAAAIGGSDFLDERLTQLETGEEPPTPRLSRRKLAWTMVGAAGLAWSFGASVIAFGGPTALVRQLCGQS